MKPTRYNMIKAEDVKRWFIHDISPVNKIEAIKTNKLYRKENKQNEK